MNKLPIVSQELIDYLELNFRNRCPSLHDTDREVWYKAGQAGVVSHLKNIKDRQEKDVYAKPQGTEGSRTTQNVGGS